MKRYSLWVKCLVFFLAVVTLLGVAVSGLGIVLAESMNMYTQGSYEKWYYDQHHNLANEIAYQMVRNYAANLSECPQWLLEQTGYLYIEDNLRDWYNLTEDDYYYIIKDENGKVVHSTSEETAINDVVEFVFRGVKDRYPVIVYREERPLAQDVIDNATSEPEPEIMPTVGVEYAEAFWDPTNGDKLFVEYITTPGYEVTVGISSGYTGYYRIHGMSIEILKWLFDVRYTLVAMAAVCFLVFAVAMILLLSIAGKDPKNGEVNPKFLNRLPLDLYLAAAVVLTIFGCWAIYELMDLLTYNRGPVVLAFVLICGCGIIVATVDVGFFMALAAQFKVSGGFWWRHSLCGRVLKLCWNLFGRVWKYIAKGFRRVGGYIRDVIGMLPVIWQWIAAGGALGFVLLLICATTTAHWYSLVPLAFWCLLFAALVIYCGYSYGVIQKGIQRMKDGDLYEKIDTQWLFGSFKTIAEDLNALADVVAIAAEKQLKSERMKTELITNVSHDIKTPLTSVINYVDLLQQPHTEEEGQQYLEVLSRQSARLKKLVEDLMDMSKASSGNMAVHITTVDAVEAVNQALGEFADKLDNAQLTPVFRKPEGQLQMQADGRLTWRVLSNLLSNVVKYALPGTRVYVDLMTEGRWVVCSIKNISREELNISTEELTERFVRGDEARNTEGSGLGLNIAQSLMHLQHGTMELTVDGDLFKVTLAFPVE